MMIGTVLSSCMNVDSFLLNMSYNVLDKEPLPDKIEWPLRNLARKCKLTSLNLNIE